MKSINILVCFLGCLVLTSCQVVKGYPSGTYRCPDIGYEAGEDGRFIFDDETFYFPYEESTPADGQYLIAGRLKHVSKRRYDLFPIEEQEGDSESDAYIEFTEDFSSLTMSDYATEKVLAECIFESDSTELYPWLTD